MFCTWQSCFIYKNHPSIQKIWILNRTIFGFIMLLALQVTMSSNDAMMRCRIGIVWSMQVSIVSSLFVLYCIDDVGFSSPKCEPSRAFASVWASIHSRLWYPETDKLISSIVLILEVAITSGELFLTILLSLYIRSPYYALCVKKSYISSAM